MDLPDWLTNMSLYHYLVLGGGVVVVLALVLYFTPVSRLKIPGIIFGIIGGLGMGIALGVIAMTFYGYQLKPTEAEGEGPPQGGMGAGGGPPGMMGGGPRAMGGGPPGMMGGRPNPKTQLATLVAKLDVLTNEPLAVRLNEEQKKKMREQLQTLDEQESLSDEDAKARLDALLDIVKEQRPTLEAAGYRWPGGGGGGRGGRPAALPNPFKDEQNGKHLRALQNQLSKKTA